MIKKASLLALVICLLLTVLSPSLIQARTGLTLLSSSAQVEFPSRFIFNMSAESDVNITGVRLCYTVDRVSFAQVTSEVCIEFVPTTTVDVSWALEMVRIGGLPPGSSIKYWWIIEDGKGEKIKTTPAQLQFDDTRYSWHSLTEGKVTIYWYEGEESFVRELMAAAQQALTKLGQNTGAYLERPAKLYIYADAQDLQGAMIYPQEWTGGVAFTRYGIMAIGIAPDNLSWGKRAIAHELAHLVIHQMTLNPYNSLPTWLDEGLAMYAEGPLVPLYKAYLDKAIAEDNLISVRSLSSPFSAYTEESLLSYAQSYSLVEFLITSYGQDMMLELLLIFKQGSSYDEALGKAYGFDMDGLDALWRDYITVPTQPVEKELMPPALIGVISALAAVLLLWLGLAIESWAWRRGW
ncbi:MAG TPA: peptidase MA domain-containing protein [Dehalococcoidia bacterium]|nr:peptidase MA domain-containing protein [Dehalococcoidia bacterium]